MASKQKNGSQKPLQPIAEEKSQDKLNMVGKSISTIAEILKRIKNRGSIKVALLSKGLHNYSYTLNMIMKFEERGLLKTEKIGRERLVSLTPLGEKVTTNTIEYIQNTLPLIC